MSLKAILTTTLSVLLFSIVNAQQLFNDKIDVIEGSVVSTRNAVIYLPANYSKTKKYPLVIFTHGIGQAGTDVNKLYATGLPRVLKNGYKPSFEFIMVAPQHPTFSVNPVWLPGILEDAEKRWSIDTNRIYLTGLSAGGQGVYGSQLNISPDFAKKFAAIVINSGVTGGVKKTNLDWWKQIKTPVWAIVGAADVNYENQTIYMVNEINKRVPGVATLTVRAGVGHGGWDDVYDGKIKIDGKTMWEWMYQFTRASKTFPGAGVTSTTTTATAVTEMVATTTTSLLSTDKAVQVNIYGGSNPYSNTAWNNWNVGTASTTNISSSTFKYNDGTASTIKAILSSSRNVNDNYGTYGSGMAPAEVLRYDSYDAAGRTLTISGLSTSKSYSIDLYASRINSTGNSTIFTINGVSKTIATYNNLTNKASFSNLTPNAQGQIVVTIKNSAAYNYLNGFTITEGSAILTTTPISSTVTPAHANYTLKGVNGSISYPDGLSSVFPNLHPGDTLNIPAGSYSLINLGAISGTASDPIIIRNSGGLVTTGEIRLQNDIKYFKLLGNGKPGLTYGFKVQRTIYSGVNVMKAREFEIAYCEVTGMTSGFFIKNNPVSTDPQTIYPNYVFKNIYIHHNYVHNIANEGMYIGHTEPQGGQGGNTLIPVRMQNVEIAYNIVDHTGWDGIQLSNATTGNKIHNNTVTNYGTSNTYAQQAGIIVGSNTNAEVYNNTIKNGTGNGIQIFGYGLTKVHNNTIEYAGKNGSTQGVQSIYCNPKLSGPETVPQLQMSIYNNTIRYPQPYGAISIQGALANGLSSIIQNNKFLIPNAPSNWQTIHIKTVEPNSTISGNTLITQ